MGMQTYEVEVKSLLGEKVHADALITRLKTIDPDTKLVAQSKQLNHYFIGGSLEVLLSATQAHLSESARARLSDIAARGKEFSVRTRQKENTVILVVKASVDDTTSQNGVTRIEFEEVMPMTLDELDQLLLDAGFQYQAKWSREREEYLSRGVTVCLDRNAGYGWLAEFEKVVESDALLGQARDEVRALMAECEVEELAQDRLERMFAFYNEHWPEYYGTDKVFTIQ